MTQFGPRAPCVAFVVERSALAPIALSPVLPALQRVFDGEVDLDCEPFGAEGGVDVQPDGGLLRRAVAGIHGTQQLRFWRDVLGAPPYILDWILHGYPLIFPHGPPPPSALPNNASARAPANRRFVTDALQELLAAGALTEVSARPHLVLPLQVATQASGKRRIIVDASRQLNNFLPDGRVKLDHLCKVAPCLDRGAWLTTTDLKSGYYHLRVRSCDRKYLGIEWQGQFFVWNVTFLGLRPLVRDFTKLLRPVMAHLGSHGLTAFIYIDDILLASPSRRHALRDNAFLRRTLASAGFVENPDKRRGPAQRLCYLGLDLDLISFSIHVPQDKLDSIRAALGCAASRRRGPVRELARLVGRVLSCLLATGPTLILLARPLFVRICESSSYDVTRSWEDLAGTFRALAHELSYLNGAPIVREDDPQVDVSEVHFSTDASASGFAVCRLFCRQGAEHRPHDGPCGSALVRQIFRARDRSRSSTFRELSAILHLLLVQGRALRHHKVVSWCDNANAERIITRGSGVPELHHLALMIHRIARRLDITLQVRWVRRTDPRIRLADELSRFDQPRVDTDDFGLSQRSFDYVVRAFGPFQFDLFAASHNAKCESYASLRLDAAAKVRDAFSVRWSTLGELYVHPPIGSLAATVRKIVAEGATGVLVLPLWPTLKGWPLVCSDGRHLNAWVVDFRIFYPDYVCHPDIQSDTFRGRPKFPTLALRFTGATKQPFRSKISARFCTARSCAVCSKTL